MNRVKLGTVLLVVSLTGCISSYFQPPPPGWAYFAGDGATEDEIKSAFLECGYPVPGDFYQFPKEVLSQLGYEWSDPKTDKKMSAANADIYYCMKNAGFPVGKLRDPCKSRNTANYAVCQPGAVIPVRSVETRLNSPFCKLYPKADLCQPGYDPKVPNCELYPKADYCQPGYDPKAPKLNFKNFNWTPSPHSCYGMGNLGCETYEDDKPQLILVPPTNRKGEQK